MQPFFQLLQNNVGKATTTVSALIMILSGVVIHQQNENVRLQGKYESAMEWQREFLLKLWEADAAGSGSDLRHEIAKGIRDWNTGTLEAKPALQGSTADTIESSSVHTLSVTSDTLDYDSELTTWPAQPEATASPTPDLPFPNQTMRQFKD